MSWALNPNFDSYNNLELDVRANKDPCPIRPVEQEPEPVQPFRTEGVHLIQLVGQEPEPVQPSRTEGVRPTLPKPRAGRPSSGSTPLDDHFNVIIIIIIIFFYWFFKTWLSLSIFLSFFSCPTSHVLLIAFHSTSGSSMSYNNSTDIKWRLFVISLTCLFRAFFCYASGYFFCMHVISIHSPEFYELSINSLLFIIFLFLQLCDDNQTTNEITEVYVIEYLWDEFFESISVN